MPYVLTLAALVGCEERPSEFPAAIFREIDLQIAKLVAAARTRLQIGSALGSNDTTLPSF